MSINFEAANMAGYNNPKIEVFKATVDIENLKIIDAPRKAEIIRCLQRGSIPAIQQTTPDGSESNMLWLGTWATTVEGDSIYFSNHDYIIAYAPDSDSPVVITGG